MKTKLDNVVYIVLAATIILGLVAMGILLTLKVTPEANRDWISGILKTIEDAFLAIVFFYWGSSKSSSEKNELLYKSTPPPVEKP